VVGFSLALGDTITSLRIWECNGIVDVTIMEFTLWVHEAFTGVPEPICVSGFMALIGSFLQYLYKANYVVKSQR
jgi:hypothetical protein